MFDCDLSAIHAYLCADGYVIRNPPSQKHKYYYIGLRNTEPVLLKDFQTKFERVFGITPIITNDGRCKVQNKNIYYELTEDFSFYSDSWKLPKLSKSNLSCWLRSYFDCDGWVSVIKAKDRKIGLESINERGILEIAKMLKEVFDITSSVKKRKTRSIHTLAICGKDDLLKFQREIGFLHPKKKEKLIEALDSYESLVWIIPKQKTKLLRFIKFRGRLRKANNEMRFFSIIKNNLINLLGILKMYKIKSEILGPWKNGAGRIFYCLSIKHGELKKLMEVKSK